MAEAAGISVSSVQRIWKAHGLQPHRVRRFKLSNDPEFVPKLKDIVGLYVDPPAHAVVLSVDEKSQIQALDRTQPGLPMKKGRAGTMTHDYKRNGTTTLFAALDVLEGKVLRIYLDQFGSNAPLAKAQMEVESGTWKALATEVAPGEYTVPAESFTRPGKHTLAITVQAGNATDLMDAVLLEPVLGTTAR